MIWREEQTERCGEGTSSCCSLYLKITIDKLPWFVINSSGPSCSKGVQCYPADKSLSSG